MEYTLYVDFTTDYDYLADEVKDIVEKMLPYMVDNVVVTLMREDN